MKYLVAGGSGFIGSHLCEKLLELGNEVFCVDNLITGREINIEHLKTNPKFTFLKWDIINPLPENIRIDAIFHLASPASPNAKSPKSYLAYPIETLLVNSVGTKNLLDRAQRCNAKFLLASTSEIYGDPLVHPQKETYWGNVNPNGIRSCYDESKRFAESITMVYHRKFSVDTRIIRIFNTYGPNMDPSDGRVIVNFIKEALEQKPLTVYGDGTQTRSLCFVDDMVNGLIKAMTSEKTNGEVINMGNSTEYTVLDIAKEVKNRIGQKSEIQFEPLPQDDPKKRKPDIEKAKTLLGWEPIIPLSEGLNKTIEYIKTQI